jgi:hypothetical protein
VCVECLILRTPSRAPCRTPSAFANRAAYPDPPLEVPDPESIDAQAAYRCRQALLLGRLRPELFPGIGVLPGPATESHIVNRGTPVAPLGQPQLNVPERKSHPRGKPLQPWVTVEDCCVWDSKERFRYFSQLNLAPNDPVGVQDAVNFYVFNNPRKRSQGWQAQQDLQRDSKRLRTPTGFT